MSPGGPESRGPIHVKALAAACVLFTICVIEGDWHGRWEERKTGYLLRFSARSWLGLWCYWYWFYSEEE